MVGGDRQYQRRHVRIGPQRKGNKRGDFGYVWGSCWPATFGPLTDVISYVLECEVVENLPAIRLRDEQSWFAGRNIAIDRLFRVRSIGRFGSVSNGTWHPERRYNHHRYVVYH
nr:hypothetical protein HmN_000893800 [Hymenolepis microstoma]